MDIVKIENIDTHPLPEGLLGASLDRPQAEGAFDSYVFNLRGWAIGDESPVETVQVLDGARLLAEVPADRARPDVAETLPAAQGVERSGFELQVRAIELEPEFELDVVARRRGGAREPLATIRGSRRRLSVPAPPSSTRRC